MTKLEAWKAWCERAGTPDLATEFTLEQSSHGKAFSFAWERGWEVGVWVECEPQEAVTEDGWCDWVCPKPTGYLMQCCDCGLIHEVDSRVAKYEPRPSEMFEVVNDPDLQVQWRMKRRDDISPKQPRQWQGLTDEEINSVRSKRDWTAPWTDTTFARAIERVLKEKNT